MAGNEQDKDTRELADELGQLMQELAGDQHDTEPTTIQPNQTDYDTELARLHAAIVGLGAEMRQADARLAQLLQAGQIEILELLVHSEQSLRRDLFQVEQGIRADLAKLLTQTQASSQAGPSDDSESTNTDG